MPEATLEFRPSRAISRPVGQSVATCYKGVVLSKTTSFSLLHPVSPGRVLLSVVSVLFLVLLTGNASGQKPKSPQTPSPQITETRKSGKTILPDQLGTVWRASGAGKQINAQNFSVVQDAEVYQEYGLQFVSTRSYSNGPNKVLIEAFEMRYPTGAYGLFTWNRGNVSAESQEFHIGRHLVRITGQAAMDQELITSLQQHFSEGPVELSPLTSHLPEQNKVANSEKYYLGPEALFRLPQFSHLKDIITFTGGAEAVTAEYENGGGKMTLLIVDCYTPQLSIDNFNRLKGLLETLSPEEKAPRLIKRPGNYVVEIVNVSDPKAAQEILNQVKYAPRVVWEGDRFSSIPYEYRPPDPLELEETRRTGAFLATTFYMIGLMLVGSIVAGIVTGAIFFQWRRYRRRKMGLDDSFTDAGGTIRLDLDDYLLSSGDDSQVKLLEKRE